MLHELFITHCTNGTLIMNAFTFPLGKNMFSVLGISRCEVLSVLDLRDTLHSIRLLENSKKYFGILLYFGSTSYPHQRIHMGLNISPSIWQSYINATLDCLQSRT